MGRIRAQRGGGGADNSQTQQQGAHRGRFTSEMKPSRQHALELLPANYLGALYLLYSNTWLNACKAHEHICNLPAVAAVLRDAVRRRYGGSKYSVVDGRYWRGAGKYEGWRLYTALLQTVRSTYM